jgi:hypothetical protein
MLPNRGRSFALLMMQDLSDVKYRLPFITFMNSTPGDWVNHNTHPAGLEQLAEHAHEPTWVGDLI